MVTLHIKLLIGVLSSLHEAMFIRGVRRSLVRDNDNAPKTRCQGKFDVGLDLKLDQNLTIR